MRREARQHETRLNVRRDLIAAFCALIACDCSASSGPSTDAPSSATSRFCSPSRRRPCSRPPSSPASSVSAEALRRIAGAAGLIAGRSLVASLSRTSIVVTALATAISMMVSVGIMVGSFRETVEVWLDSQLRADIYLRAAGPSTAGIYPPIDPAGPRGCRKRRASGDVDIFHAFPFDYEGVRATFGAGILDIVRAAARCAFSPAGFPNPRRSRL
jgi:hypothetical protein